MSEQATFPFLDALTTRAKQALDHWGLSDQTPELLKYRENAVFRVRLSQGEPAALRLHRPGYHDEHALASELSWMAVLGEAGLYVPTPVATLDGRHTVCLAETPEFDRQYADIVSWMSGQPLGQSGAPLHYAPETLPEIFRALGHAMARMHAASDAWSPPASFTRPSWDLDGLLGERPLWGRFWDCAGLLPDEAQRLGRLRDKLRQQVKDLPSRGLDYGLIHADLVRENVLLNGERIEMIDFDDGGHGWRMFDIATALFKNRQEPEFQRMAEALIEGYRAARPLSDSDLDCLPLFMVLRSVTYIGWAGDRSGLVDAAERLRRYVADTLSLAERLEAGAGAL
jgi:Ser/Thr protein kinase RdoA (MazF antagonist)